MPKTYRKPENRPEVIPPHVSLRDLRAAVGITLEQLAERIEEVSGLKPSRGTLSALETGGRGVSADLLAAIAAAYGLAPNAITTAYVPRLKATA
jgi:transcriptional regulator with XRE-family HTH domain